LTREIREGYKEDNFLLKAKSNGLAGVVGQ
jgi:hypothetical protein